MNTQMKIALVAMVLTFGKTAEAATLASAPNYGGATIANNGGSVNCRLFNAGAAAAQIVSAKIFDNAGNVQTLTANTCGSTLGAFESCEFDTIITGNLAFACRVIYSGTGALVRGVSEVLDSGGSNVNTVLMQ